jgi:uncharacterized membrane protein
MRIDKIVRNTMVVAVAIIFSCLSAGTFFKIPILKLIGMRLGVAAIVIWLVIMVVFLCMILIAEFPRKK